MDRTHHNSHSSKLARSDHTEQARDHLPAALSLLPPTDQHDGKSDERSQLQNDGEAHQKADGTPHAAEVSLIGAMAILVLWEIGAGAAQAAAALVQAVGYMDRIRGVRGIRRGISRRGIGDPFRQGDCGERAGRCYGVQALAFGHLFHKDKQSLFR